MICCCFGSIFGDCLLWLFSGCLSIPLSHSWDVWRWFVDTLIEGILTRGQHGWWIVQCLESIMPLLVGTHHFYHRRSRIRHNTVELHPPRIQYNNERGSSVTLDMSNFSGTEEVCLHLILRHILGVCLCHRSAKETWKKHRSRTDENKQFKTLWKRQLFCWMSFDDDVSTEEVRFWLYPCIYVILEE